MQELIAAARRMAILEIEKYGSPPLPNFEIANKQGQLLAEQFHLDKDIVMLGTLLMDLKLGECLKEGKLGEHTKRSRDAAATFLSQHDISEEKKEKILHCVEAHHATLPFTCKEAEICANADCYKFLVIDGWLKFFYTLGARDEFSYEQALNYAETKADEKWHALSLDFCKKELEPQYTRIKEFCKHAK